MDTGASDNWTDLADSLPGHPRHVLFCLRAGDSEEGAIVGGVAIRHQPCGERDLHSDSVRVAKPAVGGGGHSDCLGDDHLDDGGDLEALSLGGVGSSAVLHLGIDCDSLATLHHLVESLRTLL